ncbi:SocA family protein [Comamonas thiooxydans]|uniref:Panacea domain-containing protein n=1 Tax=Comamonas thiooxydans TaxID=363952 RepID=UPI0018A61BCD|nr:Panacea domain-containing protein [Comamonas thiooxydans]QOQ83843.1 SocA family protein [Comamonas thiooxydans]
MLNFGLFNERKSAQAAAYLLHMAGGTLPLLKLMKLMYLAERTSLEKYGETITGDGFVSMRHGPVLSTTYEHMNGSLRSCEGGWSSLISDRAEHQLALKDPSTIRDPEQDLLALSETDTECLKEIWDKFGGMDKWQLVEYTHSGGCPEWEDPGPSMRPIPPARLLSNVGYSPEAVQALTRRLHEQRYLNASF